MARVLPPNLILVRVKGGAVRVSLRGGEFSAVITIAWAKQLGAAMRTRRPIILAGEDGCFIEWTPEIAALAISGQLDAGQSRPRKDPHAERMHLDPEMCIRLSARLTAL